MFSQLRSNWVLILGTGLVTSFSLLPLARGELVLDAGRSDSGRVDDRNQTRSIVNSSMKAPGGSEVHSATEPTLPMAQVIGQTPSTSIPTTTVIVPASNNYGAPMATQVVTPSASSTTTTTTVSGPAEVQNLSKSELLRRDRMREELKNEDILQERLEELRLRDEKRRTDQVLANPGSAPVDAMQAPVMSAPANVMVSPPATDRPGAGMQPTQMALPQDRMVIPAQAQAVPVSTAQAEDSERTKLSVAPRAGLSNMSGTTYFNVQSKYSAGVSLGMQPSDNMVFELGYLYSEYGISLASTNPYVQYAQYASGTTYNTNFQSQILKQNVVDANLKLYVLGPESKFRPYLGGGAGYSKSFLNYDPSIIQQLRNQGFRNMTQDYTSSAFLGVLSTGFDIKLSKSVNLGMGFKYYSVLSSSENQNLNSAAFAGNPQGFAGYGQVLGFDVQDPQKQQVGSSLAKSNFYSILGSVSFSF